MFVAILIIANLGCLRCCTRHCHCPPCTRHKITPPAFHPACADRYIIMSAYHTCPVLKPVLIRSPDPQLCNVVVKRAPARSRTASSQLSWPIPHPKDGHSSETDASEFHVLRVPLLHNPRGASSHTLWCLSLTVSGIPCIDPKKLYPALLSPPQSVLLTPCLIKPGCQLSYLPAQLRDHAHHLFQVRHLVCPRCIRPCVSIRHLGQ